MQERSRRNSSYSKRSTSSSRSERSSGSSYDRSQRRSRSTSSSASNRRRNMGTVGDDSRIPPGTPQRLRGGDARSNTPQMRTSSRNDNSRRRSNQGGYPLRRNNSNLFGRGGYVKGRSSYNPQLIVFAGVGIALLILLIFFIVSCAASCGRSEFNPTENISESLEGELRTQVEAMVTSDYQSTYVAEHAENYPSDLIQLMVSEPAATSFVFNYPDASHEAQPYDGDIAQGSVPLLYDWDPRWGYVDYAGSVIGVTGSGPTSVAMARMGLLGSGDMTPATIATNVTQLGGATGESFMSASIFGANSNDDSTDSNSGKDANSDVVDEDGDGIDDVTGEEIQTSNTGSDNKESNDSKQTSGSGQSLAQLLGLSAQIITVEPGSSVTESFTGALGNHSYVLVETINGAFGTQPHWVVAIAMNEDGSIAVYDPTSPSNSLHPWDPSTVVENSSSLIALSDPNAPSDDDDATVDEDGDGYDDKTGVYIGSE